MSVAACGSHAGVVETSADARLAELAAVIQREAELARLAAEQVVVHAIACGEAMLEAKALIPPGRWTAWCEANLPFGKRFAVCRTYTRLAALKDHVDPDVGIAANIQLLKGLPGLTRSHPQYPDSLKDEARRLRASGLSQHATALRLGVTQQTVKCWVDPEYAERSNREKAARKRAARIARGETVRRLPSIEAPRYLRYGEPGRAAIGQAVRRLAQVEGRKDTAEALRDLEAICAAWAERLESPVPHERDVA